MISTRGAGVGGMIVFVREAATSYSINFNLKLPKETTSGVDQGGQLELSCGSEKTRSWQSHELFQ